MSYRFDMRDRDPQAQAIVRAREKEEKLRIDEKNKKQDFHKHELEKRLLAFLKEQDEPKTANGINKAIQGDGKEVLRTLNDLFEQRKIDMVVIENKETNINAPHYLIKI